MELLTFFPLAFMIRSDFRERTVGLYPLVFFGILAAVNGCVVYGVEECLCRVGQNGSVLLLLAGSLAFYLAVRYGWRMNIFRGYAGSGDWWFLFCLTPLFGLTEYVRFLVGAFLLSLIWWGIYAGRREKKCSIPLVSTVGICYAAYLLFRLIFRYFDL